MGIGIVVLLSFLLGVVTGEGDFHWNYHGGAAQVTITGNQNPAIEAGGLGNRYKFLQLHFHWGKSDSRGSEHTINGKEYPMEMHLVHYNNKYSPSDADKHHDGLAVLGVLFMISKEDNQNLSAIIDKLSSIQYKNSEVNLDKGLKLKSLLPDTFPYFRYSGSLTTPPCSEVVTWTVFVDTVEISTAQLKQFRNLKEGMPNEDSMALVDNHRPIQSLNQRFVHIASGFSDNINSGSHHLTSTFAIVITCLITFLHILK
ncbi:carbonic anhydrase 1-like isoform X2 [Tachypleus tridentatus]|uniref:carbonic anhydrase 1-like isoform X2 n=1 Tax=Tachypleus tridentatus TaxID=6853 RepID=UPI003FD464B4